MNPTPETSGAEDGTPDATGDEDGHSTAGQPVSVDDFLAEFAAAGDDDQLPAEVTKGYEHEHEHEHDGVQDELDDLFAELGLEAAVSEPTDNQLPSEPEHPSDEAIEPPAPDLVAHPPSLPDLEADDPDDEQPLPPTGTTLMMPGPELYDSIDDDRADDDADTDDRADDVPPEPPEASGQPVPALVFPAAGGRQEPGGFMSTPSSLSSEPRPSTPPLLTVPDGSIDQDRRRWLNLGIALAAGLIVGLIAAILIARDNGDDGDAGDGGDAVASEVEDGGESNQTGSEAGDETVVGAPLSVVPETIDAPLTLNSVRFVPGRTDLTDTGQDTMSSLITALKASPSATAAVTVRTFSELTADANAELSNRQADALSGLAAEAGVGDRVAVTALGSLPPSPSHPSPNFVAVSAGLGQAGLGQELPIDRVFSLGLDSDGRSLRSEAQPRLAELGSLLALSPGGEISLAGYSYDEATTEENRAEAALAVDSVADALVHRHGVDPNQISRVVAGSAPYEIPASVGGLVTIEVSPEADLHFEVASLAWSTVSFVPGTSSLTDEAAVVVDELGRQLSSGERDGVVVIDIATFDESSDQANLDLGRSQATTLEQALTEAGAEASRFRVEASGADSHRPVATSSTVVTASVA